MNWVSKLSTGRFYAFLFAFLLATIILCPSLLAGQNSYSRLVNGTADAMPSEQGYVNFRSLQTINSLPDTRITSLDQAKAYVKQVAEACGVQGPILIGELLPRLVRAELAAAQDPSQLVSDDRVADAFNFLSDEFRVPHPQRLTGTEVLQFRTTMSAIYPHVFSPKSMSGSRPVAALITLHQLVFNGGVPEGAKKYAQKDPQPGSFKIDPSRTRMAIDKNPNPIAREYRTASATYFHGLTSEKMQPFVDSIAKIMALPAGR